LWKKDFDVLFIPLKIKNLLYNIYKDNKRKKEHIMVIDTKFKINKEKGVIVCIVKHLMMLLKLLENIIY